MSEPNQTPEQSAPYRRTVRNPNERAAWRAYAIAALTGRITYHGWSDIPTVVDIADKMLDAKRERFGEP